MRTRFGSLEVADIAGSERLLAEPVLQAASTFSPEDIGVAAIDPDLSDTKQFCEQYGVGMDQAANCVILAAKRGERTWHAACVVLGSTRADVNGIARRTLDARSVSFAPMEDAVAATGMEYGAITPIGLPEGWPILVDKAVADAPAVIVGSGKRESKLLVTGAALARLPGAQVLEGLGRTA